MVSDNVKLFKTDGKFNMLTELVYVITVFSQLLQFVINY